MLVIVSAMSLCIMAILSDAKNELLNVRYNHGIRYCEQQCLATCGCLSVSYDKGTLKCVLLSVSLKSIPKLHTQKSKWSGCPRGTCVKLQPFFLTRQHECKETHTRTKRVGQKGKKGEKNDRNRITHKDKTGRSESTDAPITVKNKPTNPLFIKHAVTSTKYDKTIYGFEKKLKKNDNRIQVAGQDARLNKIIRFEFKRFHWTTLIILGMATRINNDRQHHLYVLGMPQNIIDMPHDASKFAHLINFKEMAVGKERQTVSMGHSRVLQADKYKLTEIRHITLDKQFRLYAVYGLSSYKVLRFQLVRASGQYKGAVNVIRYPPAYTPYGIHAMPNGYMVLVYKKLLKFFELKRGKLRIIRTKPEIGKHPLKLYMNCYVSFSPNSNYMYSVVRNSPYNVESYWYQGPN